MVYSLFNDYIRERFFGSDKIGTNVVLSVDNHTINEFCDRNKISKINLEDEFKRVFSEDWSLALETENFFGLIAIQIYIAHSMAESEIYTKNEYNRRLSDFLRKDRDHAFYINILYERYQEHLWLKLKNWCQREGYYLEIPEKRKYKGRYIQYPLSQALLNQDDLDHLPILFVENGLKPSENLCLQDLQCIVKNNEPRELPKHYFKVKDRLIKEDNEELLYRQIFEHYCCWEGEIVEVIRRKVQYGYITDKFNNQIFLSKAKTEILVLNDQNVNIDINCSGLFQKISKYCRLSHKDLIFFIKDDYYEDWEASRYLAHGRSNLILCNRGNIIEQFVKRIDPLSLFTLKGNYTLIEFEIDKNFNPDSFWERYFSKEKAPVSIQNGLKLDRKTWMHQAGPDLIFDRKVDAWLNGRKIEINDDNPKVMLRNCDEGIYIIRTSGSRSKIEIKKPIITDVECSSGWIINRKAAKWDPTNAQFHISGLVNKFSCELSVESEIRSWIKANIGDSETLKGQDTTLNINAINRAKHGIRY